MQLNTSLETRVNSPLHVKVISVSNFGPVSSHDCWQENLLLHTVPSEALVESSTWDCSFSLGNWMLVGDEKHLLHTDELWCHQLNGCFYRTWYDYSLPARRREEAPSLHSLTPMPAAQQQTDKLAPVGIALGGNRTVMNADRDSNGNLALWKTTA